MASTESEAGSIMETKVSEVDGVMKTEVSEIGSRMKIEVSGRSRHELPEQLALVLTQCLIV